MIGGIWNKYSAQTQVIINSSLSTLLEKIAESTFLILGFHSGFNLFV